MKYAVITFGCRVNQADSLGFEEGAARGRRGAAPPPDRADLVVVNTCSVTATADQGARQTIRRIARDNPERPHRRHRLLRDAPARRGAARCPTSSRVSQRRQAAACSAMVRAVFGLTTADSRRAFGDGDGSCGAAIEPGVAGRTAFTLRVQTGCAEPCSYCIIPATRGRPRSVPIEASSVRSIAWWRPASRRSRSPACISAPTAAI